VQGKCQRRQEYHIQTAENQTAKNSFEEARGKKYHNVAKQI
jgi:hypothetical protein